MIKVLIVDDSFIFRSGLETILKQDPEIEVLGCAANGKEAFEFCGQMSPDLILMDIRMDVCNGVEGAKLIKDKYKAIKIVMLTTFDDNEYITQALKNGADGYILKGVNDEDLIMTIKSTMKGLSVFEQKVLSNVKDQYRNIGGHSKIEIALSEREKQLLQEIVDGKTNKEIASNFGLAEGTIKNMISNLLVKFKLNDRTQLAIFAVKNNLV